MPYYRGDYVGGRSNYYRGDPFLGALVGATAGKLLGKAGSWIGKQIAGSPKKAATAITTMAAAPILTAAAPFLPSIPIPGTGQQINPGNFLPGGAPLFSPRAGKRYRRMNPLNPRALKRALRRAEGFEKFAKKTVNALYKTVDGRRVKSFKKTSKRS